MDHAHGAFTSCQKPSEGKDKYGVSPPLHLTLYEACGRDSVNEF